MLRNVIDKYNAVAFNPTSAPFEHTVLGRLFMSHFGLYR